MCKQNYRSQSCNVKAFATKLCLSLHRQPRFWGTDRLAPQGAIIAHDSNLHGPLRKCFALPSDVYTIIIIGDQKFCSFMSISVAAAGGRCCFHWNPRSRVGFQLFHTAPIPDRPLDGVCDVVADLVSFFISMSEVPQQVHGVLMWTNVI